MARSKKVRGYLRRRGRSWQWIVGVGGKAHTFYVRAESKAEAATWCAKKLRELEEEAERTATRARRGFTAVSLTVTQLIARFVKEGLATTKTWGERRAITRRKYASSLVPLQRYFEEHGDPPVARLVSLDDYLKWRAPDVAVSSLAQERVVASAMFDWAVREGLLDHNPARQSTAPKVKQRQPVIITDAELQRLLEECGDPMLRFYVVVLAETGVRCESECLWLRWEDLNRVLGFLEVACFDHEEGSHLTKNGESREVPITARLQTALTEHVSQFRYDGTDSPWVFHDPFGVRIGRLDDAFRRALARARKPRRPGDVVVPRAFRRQHDLRARRITTWLDEGQNVVHVRQWVGHKDLATTMRYYGQTRKALQPPRLAPVEAVA